MERRTIIAGYRALFGVLALAAIAVQLIDLAGRGVLAPLNFFSYFTIQSNLIGAAVLLIGAARRSSPRSDTFDFVRGVATVYLTVTLVVFALLLSGTDVDTAIPWVNSVVHEVTPLVLLADWLIDPPARRIAPRASLASLVYPLG